MFSPHLRILNELAESLMNQRHRTRAALWRLRNLTDLVCAINIVSHHNLTYIRTADWRAAHILNDTRNMLVRCSLDKYSRPQHAEEIIPKTARDHPHTIKHTSRIKTQYLAFENMCDKTETPERPTLYATRQYRVPVSMDI